MAIDFGRKLGFGTLRLPLLNPKDQGSIDYETLNKMIDKYLEHGFKYFDTSYIYHDYQSEIALRECLVKRHPRDSYLISTKMPIKYMHKKEDMETIFQEQMEKIGVPQLDFYLIHSINQSAYENCNKWGTFDFLKKKREEGYFREFGVSLHDSPEFLEKILTEHPEIDFVVEQLNYIDWNSPAIRSKEIYEVAVKHNKPIVVMEACKGGTLANVPEKAEKLMKAYNPDASVASWAYRFCASLPGVRIVLAGMPNMEFLDDNIRTIENFVPLNEEEYRIIDEVVKIINEDTAIPCTTCRYCEPVCPKKITIPDFFNLYNDSQKAKKSPVDNHVNTQAIFYTNMLDGGATPASGCIKCHKCEKVCPQKLPITRYLENVRDEFEGWNALDVTSGKK